jgi:hypothetical protein
MVSITPAVPVGVGDAVGIAVGSGVGDAVGDEVAVSSGWLVDVGVSVGSGVHVAVASGSGVGAVTSALVAGGVVPLQAIKNSKAQSSRTTERDRIIFMVVITSNCKFHYPTLSRRLLTSQ